MFDLSLIVIYPNALITSLLDEFEDINTLSLDALMSILKIHEMRSKKEENIKNTKSVALKANKDESDLDNWWERLGISQLNSNQTIFIP